MGLLDKDLDCHTKQVYIFDKLGKVCLATDRERLILRSCKARIRTCCKLYFTNMVHHILHTREAPLHLVTRTTCILFLIPHNYHTPFFEQGLYPCNGETMSCFMHSGSFELNLKM